MILPDLQLASTKNARLLYSGIDSLKNCFDKQHFISYPHNVSYCYNSRGFRDAQWPAELDNVIWCVGDSFTVGIGSPVPHTWVNILQQRTSIRCINVSMDGASNKWIHRKVRYLLDNTTPKTIVVHWSFIHRDETDSGTDEDRRLWNCKGKDTKTQLLEFVRILQDIEENKKSTKVVHSFIPDWSTIKDYKTRQVHWLNIRGPEWPQNSPSTIDELDKLPSFVSRALSQDGVHYTELVDSLSYFNRLDAAKSALGYCINEFDKLDLARDGFHYDIKTATKFVDSILLLGVC